MEGLLAPALSIGVGLYAAAAAAALLLARAPAPEDAAGLDPRVLRYHAMLKDYAAGARIYGLMLAVAAYGAAAIALFQGDAAALYWLAAAMAGECVMFLLWPQRGAFLDALSPAERMSEAMGVAALSFALLMTAYLRFSGALA